MHLLNGLEVLLMSDDMKKNIDTGKEISDYRIQLEMRDKSRIENFVDAVFAIAMTLLVLDLSIPVVTDSNVAVLSFLGSLWPKFVGYFLAFFVLGMLLNNHHRQFLNIKYTDQKIWWINILFLAFICLVPFSTAVMSEYGDTITAVIIFNLILLIAGLLLYINWARVVNHKILLIKDITPQTIQTLKYRNLSVPLAALLATGLAFISPRLSVLGYLLIIIIYLFTKASK